MNDLEVRLEECRKVSCEKLIEVTDYVHNCDIPTIEKQKRTLELAITLFMSTIRINTEVMARSDVDYHLSLLKEAVEETIELHFHEKKPTSCEVITDYKTYTEKNDEYKGI